LAELENVAVDVLDSELAHAVVEVFKRIDDGNFFTKLPPKGIHILDLKIERAGKNKLVEGQIFIGERHHDFGVVTPQGCPGCGTVCTRKTEEIGIEADGVLDIGDVENGSWSFELHESLRGAGGFS